MHFEAILHIGTNVLAVLGVVLIPICFQQNRLVRKNRAWHMDHRPVCAAAKLRLANAQIRRTAAANYHGSSRSPGRRKSRNAGRTAQPRNSVPADNLVTTP